MIPRIEMPQIRRGEHEALRSWLHSHNVGSFYQLVHPDHLRMHQKPDVFVVSRFNPRYLHDHIIISDDNTIPRRPPPS